jgi:hypothetical protein
MEKLSRYKDILVKNKLGNVEVMDHQYVYILQYFGMLLIK